MTHNGNDIKDLRRYVAKASKGDFPLDLAEVRARLNAIPYDALKAYWADLQPSLVFRSAQAIPDYRSREQREAIHDAAYRYAWTTKPGEDPAESLRAHLSHVLLQEITSEQRKRAEFRAQPWYVRMHAYWAMAFVGAVFLTMPILFFESALSKKVDLVMTLVWGAFLLTGVLITGWVRWRRRSGT